MRLLAFTLLALAASSPGVSGQATVSIFADLQAAVAAGGQYTIASATPIILNGSTLVFNSTNATVLELTGDLSVCGGLCTLDANFTSGHFDVLQGTLRLRNLRLINSVRGLDPRDSEPCRTAASVSLTGQTTSIGAYWDSSSSQLVDAGSMPDSSQYCGAIVVGAYASLVMSGCEISYAVAYSQDIYASRVCLLLQHVFVQLKL